MCRNSVSGNVGVALFFLFVFVQTSWNCVLFHITPAGHLGLNNINKEPKTRKEYNLLVCFSPMIHIQALSFYFPAGDRYDEFLCYNI
jgi:hypothetical protein